MRHELSREFLKFMRYCQDNDLTVDGAMTDPKATVRWRRNAPAPDPDMYLRVVERRPDGIVVRAQKRTRRACSIPTK